MRQTSTGKNGTRRRTLHHEPSASGIAASRSNAPEYIGCRTYAYRPDLYLNGRSGIGFDFITAKNNRKDSTIIAFAMTDTTGATGDQPKR